MHYSANRIHNSSADFPDMLLIPNTLTDFVNSGTETEMTDSGREAYCFHGDLYYDQNDYICRDCGCRMEIHNRYHVQLRHVCIGDKVTFVMLDKHRFMCPKCRQTVMQPVPFQAEHHRITVELLRYTEELLSGGYTNKEVSSLTGLHQAVVKNIDKQWLQRLYTVDGKTFKKPEKQARHLAIDEFKLHDGYKFATHIIDLERGHVLWIQEGKKKQVVYDFIDFVGQEWMDSVEAVACDMNSDFQEAFEERCPDNVLRSIKQSVIRGGQDFRIFYTFNPPRSRNNWANLYVERPDPNAITFRTTYEQMPVEWLGETFITEAEQLRAINPDAYRHEYGGEAIGTGGEVFPNVIQREITDEEINGFSFVYAGIDWGFSVDPFAFVRVAYDSKKRTVYVLNEIVKRGVSNAEAAALIIERGFDRGPGYASPFGGYYDGGQRIIADSAEPKSIADMRREGLHVVPCDKYPGSVQRGIKWLQGRYIVIDERRTPIAFQEFSRYEYQHTKDGQFTSDLVDADNHCVDAVRYALNDLLRKESA